ncbi:hypothetical protein GCM10009647_089220 [Streptomyces sanglieri]
MFGILPAKNGTVLVVDQPASLGALPIAVVRDMGCEVNCLPGLTMRRIAGLYPGEAKPPGTWSPTPGYGAGAAGSALVAGAAHSGGYSQRDGEDRGCQEHPLARVVFGRPGGESAGQGAAEGGIGPNCGCGSWS